MIIQADELLKNKKYAEARVLYQSALEQGDEEAFAYLGIAIATYHLGEYSESESSALKTLELNGSLYKALLILAYIYARRKDYESCEDAINQALIIAPDDPDILSFAGGVYLSNGRAKEGIVMLSKALQIKPNDWMAYFNLGSYYFSQKNYKGAAQQYLNSLKYKKSFSVFIKLLILFVYIYRVTIIIITTLLTLTSFYLESTLLLFIVTMPIISVGLIGIINKYNKGLLIFLLGLIPWMMFLLMR